MASENEINRELKELNSSLSGISRRPPFERDQDFLDKLSGSLADSVRQNIQTEKKLETKRNISFPIWARGIAAAIMLMIPGSILYRWMNPETIERKMSRELRTLDAGSIENYLQQNSLEVDESGVSKLVAETNQWQANDEIASLSPDEIENYLKTYPPFEESQN